jgi:predicted dienelactone hydrolase
MFKFRSFIRKQVTALSLSLFTLGGVIPEAVYPAEKIFFVYSPVIASLKVKSLEQFAEDGTISQDLGFYLNLAKVNEEEKAKFREALTKPVKIDAVLLSRSLNTEEAERLLNYFGSVINIKGGSNGKYLLRGALVQAALEEEGLTLLNVLKKLAVDVQVNVQQILQYSDQIELVIKGSELFAAEITSLAEKEAQSEETIDFSQKPDIRLPGPFKYKHSTLNLYDAQRNREFYVELYQPQELKGDNIPVVIYSHGLSSSPEGAAKLAIYLASYGYVVAMPQHPGSDIRNTEDFVEGYTRQIFEREEFINRPKDISFVLDELTRLNETQFQGKLNLESVGMAGHSFGGYTALAVAGAKLNFETLEDNCNSSIGNLNSALLLQCRALKLDRERDYDFRDSRVKAVFVSNPVNASIFHEQGLKEVKVPTFVSAGSYDPATPFVFEQGRTFPFIGSSDAYLQLQEGQAHVDFSELDAGITDLIETVGNLTLPTPDLLDSYTHSMALAFFQVHLNDQQDYKIYLQSSYAEYLSQGQEFKTYLITKTSVPELRDKYEQFIQDNRDLILDE